MLLGSLPEYAEINDGINTDWLFFPYPWGKPNSSSPFEFPLIAANLFAIISLFFWNVSKVFELYWSLLLKAVLIKIVEIAKFPEVFGLSALYWLFITW